VADSLALDALAHEMARRVGCSHADARSALDELQRAGLVAVEARGVVLPMHTTPSPVSVAIWGMLAAALTSRAGRGGVI
jgi:DNA-binding FadR family transcriptional regulator